MSWESVFHIILAVLAGTYIGEKIRNWRDNK
jgi:hypothetical protein